MYYNMYVIIVFIFIIFVIKIISRLFGAEDVDLRTLTAPSIVPTPPPPPQISETPIPEVGKSWAKYKEVKPDTFKTPYKSPIKQIPNELNDKLVENNDTMDVDMRTKPTQSKSHILRQAQEALNAGSITFDEYHHKIMCRVRNFTYIIIKKKKCLIYNIFYLGN